MPEGESSAAGGTGAGDGAAGGTGGQGGSVNPDNINAGAAAGGTGGAGDGGAGGGEEKFDASYVKQLRDEAAKTRAELKRVSAALQAKTDAELSDTEKATKRSKELEEENTALLAKIREAEVHQAAAKAGAAHPEVVAKLVDADKELDTELKRIKAAYPALFGKARPAGSADAGSGGDPPAAKQDMNAFIRAASGR